MNHFTSEQELIDTKSNHRFTRILVVKFSIILFSHSFVWWPFFSSESESNFLFLYWLFFFSFIYVSRSIAASRIYILQKESCLCTVAAPSRHVSKPSQFIHAEFCNTKCEPRKHLLLSWQKYWGRGQLIERPEKEGMRWGLQKTRDKRKEQR